MNTKKSILIILALMLAACLSVAALAESPADTPAGNAPQSPEVSPTDRMRIIKEIMITHEKDGQVTGDAPSGQPAPEFHEDRTEELTDDCRDLCGGEDGATNGVPQETDKTEECPPNPECPPAPQKDGTSPVIPICGALAALLEAEAGAFPFLGMYGSGFTRLKRAWKYAAFSGCAPST